MTALPLRVQGLSKRYGPRAVLDGLDLDVNPGEAVVLRGPNGAGKSTLLGCVCGTIIPDAGTVSIDGHELAKAPLLARSHLRYLPQEVEVPPGLTGAEILQFYADVFGQPGKASDAAELSRLGPALQRLATTYSVGMRRQLVFAAVTVGKPALMVLDEPFAGVDVDGRGRMRQLLSARMKDGMGLLLAAHDQDVADLEALEARRVDLEPAPEPEASKSS